MLSICTIFVSKESCLLGNWNSFEIYLGFPISNHMAHRSDRQFQLPLIHAYQPNFYPKMDDILSINKLNDIIFIQLWKRLCLSLRLFIFFFSISYGFFFQISFAKQLQFHFSLLGWDINIDITEVNIVAVRTRWSFIRNVQCFFMNVHYTCRNTFIIRIQFHNTFFYTCDVHFQVATALSSYFIVFKY